MRAWTRPESEAAVVSAHTPGPWVLEDEGGGEFSVVNREHAGDDWDICTVHSTKANAYLIAAAPLLLALAKDFVRECAHCSGTGFEPVFCGDGVQSADCEYCADIRALIEAACGEGG